jgi:hypothetical protein
MILRKKNLMYELFIASIFLTEFYYINIGSGIARIYHFFAIIILLSNLSSKSIYALFKSPIFGGLIFFVFINILALFYSDDPASAGLSFLSFLANLGVAIAISLTLMRNRISLDRLVQLILIFTMLSVLWGLIQIVSYKAGILLALSPEQESQISIGFGPGFRTEANAFGKFLIFPFLLFLPYLLNKINYKQLRYAYMFMIVGILMNFTRSSIIGLSIALMYISIWYTRRRKFHLLANRLIQISAIVGGVLFLIFSGIITMSDYGKFKIENLFNSEEILKGGSTEFRISGMEQALDYTLNDNKRILIGNGWGQIEVELQDQIMQGGGNDFINILGFSGALGIVAYLIASVLVFRSLSRAAKRSSQLGEKNLAAGLLFSFIGLFAIGQLVGNIISPEYWTLIGIAIYVSMSYKTKYSVKKQDSLYPIFTPR